MDKQKQIEEMTFIVIDNKTGKEADIGKIALKEDWAKGLMYCDMEGFALLQDGNLVLMDECGRYEYCPSGRFTIIHENAVVLTREEFEQLKQFEYKVRSGVCFTKKEWFDYINEDSNRRTSLQIKSYEKGIKETAEKFAERLKEKLEENSPIAGYDLEDLEFDGETIQECIDEICKELTGDKNAKNE